uniref:Ig-like domain-containing protein n=1 Tax=Hydatigena taeniaeformis TaxID=6205 RepID=A0A0R3X9D1_HYDTA
LKEAMHNITYNPQDESVRFLCDIVGQPIPNITWYRGNKRIRPDDGRGKYRIKPKLWGTAPSDKTTHLFCLANRLSCSTVDFYDLFGTSMKAASLPSRPRLRIKNPTPEDFGEYTCAAENAGGKRSTTAWLLPQQRQKARVKFLESPKRLMSVGFLEPISSLAASHYKFVCGVCGLARA